ncbi:MAG: PepSY-like domain-containing protein, partial [Paramuribaculum sp.]|nr:PepSY-like domain-containing protein [Paramuribaculum sp.]
PMESVQSYTENSNGTYTVIIHNGTEILFDANQEWTSISGRGNTLPEVLIEDQCPSPLVQYITEMEFLDQVYELSRTNNSYHVVFLNTYIDYSIDDGKITYPQK